MNRVYLVDDEKYVLSSFIATIDWEQMGFSVAGQCTDSAQAVDAILNLRPDLVFVDVRMPGLSGLEVMRRVREKNPDILFAVVSGYAEFAYVHEALRQGAVDYCLKPFNRQEINELLRRVGKMLKDRPHPRPALPEIEPREPVKTRNNTLSKILAEIHKNYLANLSVEQISRQYGLNHNYVSQLFKRETGKTFTEYVVGLRIEHANRLLSETTLPISEVAEMVGYQDYFYFARVYKKATGTTPSKYRRASAGTEAE